MKLDVLVELFARTHIEMQNRAAKSVDVALVVRNWLFGWYIVEFEQHGEDRAIYGSRFLENLSEKLKAANIKGSSETRLKLYRSFYLKYKSIRPTLSDELCNLLLDKSKGVCPTSSDESQPLSFKSDNPVRSVSIQLMDLFALGWSHYSTLLTIDDDSERSFYEIEAAQNSWSVRELKRQIESSLFQRLALSADKAKIKELSQKGHIVATADDIVKNPYVLEFLNLKEHAAYTEHELETAIIDKLEHFLLELGKGFLFEARQKRFTFDDKHFYVDLVFYNRLLQCYVLIDLKRDELTHQDIGQMQMYVNYFDRHVKLESESPTVGILLCHRKSDALVELTLPQDSNIYASKYQLYLPSKAELKRQIEESLREQGKLL